MEDKNFKMEYRDNPGDPVVKALYFHRRDRV